MLNVTSLQGLRMDLFTYADESLWMCRPPGKTQWLDEWLIWIILLMLECTLFLFLSASGVMSRSCVIRTSVLLCVIFSVNASPVMPQLHILTLFSAQICFICEWWSTPWCHPSTPLPSDSLLPPTSQHSPACLPVCTFIIGLPKININTGLLLLLLHGEANLLIYWKCLQIYIFFLI